MKITTLSFVLAISLVAVSSAPAGEKNKDQKQSKPAAPAKPAKAPAKSTQKDGKVLLTGSYIKQDVRRNGRITDGPSQVIVLDRETIERTGAGDLKQLLVHQGIH